MPARDPHMQDRGPDLEEQRRVEPSASPSMPAGDRSIRVDLERGRRPFAQRPLRRPPPRPRARRRRSRRAGRHRSAGACPSRPPVRAGSGCWTPGPWRPRDACRPARSSAGRARCCRGRACRARCRAGCAAWRRGTLALDGLGVEPERDVVDEDASVDLGEVDAALAAVDERVERADDVVAVDAEVEREVVARARGHARVGEPRSAATAATIACEPSPPAIASASAPRVDRVADELSRSSRGPSSIGSIPRARASSGSGSARPCRRRSAGCRTAPAARRGASPADRTWTPNAARAAATTAAARPTTSSSASSAPAHEQRDRAGERERADR